MDKRYLEWHGRQWRVQLRVPERLRQILKCSRLVVPLHTDSLAVANLRKFKIVAELKDRIAAAEQAYKRQTNGFADALADEALVWKADIAHERLTAVEDEDGYTYEALPDLLYDRAKELERTLGEDKASDFYKTAMGLATPISSLIDAWLAERMDMKVRQRNDYRRAVIKFIGWLQVVRLPASIEEATRKTAGRYVSEAMVKGGVNWKTANKDISALSGYWKWLVKKGYVEANIWSNQSLPKIKDRFNTPRPFTDAEVATLISGINTPLLADAIMIGALSGMRVDEIARLRVGDILGQCFVVRDAKTDAGVRQVPIHALLSPIVLKRTAGKGAEDYLFDELSDPAPGSAVERGQGISKKFVTARRKLGVDDRVEGKRQSRVTFHSFRRWFVATSKQALANGAIGFDPWTIADVVGHDREGLPEGLAMTMGRYAGDSSISAKVACVNSVRLPDPLSASLTLCHHGGNVGSNTHISVQSS